jgi:hypothetical protein
MTNSACPDRTGTYDDHDDLDGTTTVDRLRRRSTDYDNRRPSTDQDDRRPTTTTARRTNRRTAGLHRLRPA